MKPIEPLTVEQVRAMMSVKYLEDMGEPDAGEYWLVRPQVRRLKHDDVPAYYVVCLTTDVVGGCIIYSVYDERWMCNPHSVRSLVATLLGLISAPIVIRSAPRTAEEQEEVLRAFNAAMALTGAMPIVPADRTSDDDVRHLQDVVRAELIRSLKRVFPNVDHSHRIDGGGSDGDEFDFTRIEVSIATGLLEEEIGRLRALKAARAAVVAEVPCKGRTLWGHHGSFGDSSEEGEGSHDCGACRFLADIDPVMAKAGAEAEELRRAMERYTDGPIAVEMQKILDDVDARDSLRLLEELDRCRKRLGEMKAPDASVAVCDEIARRRARAVMSWGLKHDDEHGWSELARAAMEFLAGGRSGHGPMWAEDEFYRLNAKPEYTRRDSLIDAGQFIVAAIEAYDREQAAKAADVSVG